MRPRQSSPASVTNHSCTLLSEPTDLGFHTHINFFLMPTNFFKKIHYYTHRYDKDVLLSIFCLTDNHD